MSKSSKKDLIKNKNKNKIKIKNKNKLNSEENKIEIEINSDGIEKIDFPEIKNNKNNKNNNKKRIKIIEDFNSPDFSESSANEESENSSSQEKELPKPKPKPINGEQKKVVDDLNNQIKKKGRGRPRKNEADKKPQKPKAAKKFDESVLDEEEQLERCILMDQYKKYRASFDFKREEIKPETLSNIQLEYEVDQLKTELDSQGGLVCAQVLMTALFSGIEIGSKMFPIGLKLEGLSNAVSKNQKQFDSVLKELMIKYNLFSSSCEMRFGMLVVQTILACHTANTIKEKFTSGKNDIVDPQKISELQNKYSNL